MSAGKCPCANAFKNKILLRTEILWLSSLFFFLLFFILLLLHLFILSPTPGTFASFSHSFALHSSTKWMKQRKKYKWKQTEPNPVKKKIELSSKVGTINFDYVFGFSHFAQMLQWKFCTATRVRVSVLVNRNLRQVRNSLSKKKKTNERARKILLFIRSHIQLILSEGIKQWEMPSFEFFFSSSFSLHLYSCVLFSGIQKLCERVRREKKISKSKLNVPFSRIAGF